MKKLIGIGIAAMMVMGLAGTANAYLIGASAKDSAGKNFVTALSFGDLAAAKSPVTVQSGNVVMVLPTDQTWTPSATAAAQTWNTKYWNPAATLSTNWIIALYGKNYVGQGSETTARVRFFMSSIGNDGNQGKKLTAPISFKLTDLSTNKVVSTGTWSGLTGETNSFIDLFLPVINTDTPEKNAAIYSFTTAVPEPGSMLAMFSGLVGLAGFGIRRRK